MLAGLLTVVFCWNGNGVEGPRQTLFASATQRDSLFTHSQSEETKACALLSESQQSHRYAPQRQQRTQTTGSNSSLKWNNQSGQIQTAPKAVCPFTQESTHSKANSRRVARLYYVIALRHIIC